MKNVHSFSVVCLAAIPFLSLPANSFAADLIPIPNDGAQEPALALIQEVYGDRITAAKSTEDRLAVANVLLADAAVAKDPINRFVLYRVARDLAMNAGDADLAIQIVKDTAKHFSLGSDQDKAMLGAILLSLQQTFNSTKATEQFEALVRHAQMYQDQAVEMDDLDHAIAFGKVADAAARETKSTKLVKDVVATNNSVLEVAKAFEGVKLAITQLANDPTHAAANLDAGKYYCLMKGEWEKGMPLLALSGDDELKAIALAELGDNADPMALGDGWWEIASQETNTIARKHLEARAAHWYTKAFPDAVGIVKAKIVKRMSEVTGRDFEVDDDGWIDLLDFFDPNSTYRGSWERRGKAVRVLNTLPKSGETSHVSFPVSVIGSYELAGSFTRIDGDGGIGFAFPIGESFSCRAKVGERSGGLSGLAPIRGKFADQNETTVSGTHIANGKTYSLHLVVEMSGTTRVRVAVRLNGKTIIDWNGIIEDTARLPGVFGLYSGDRKTEIIFHSVKLKVRDGFPVLKN